MGTTVDAPDGTEDLGGLRADLEGINATLGELSEAVEGLREYVVRLASTQDRMALLLEDLVVDGG
ncbi:MAG: hypothetical protein NTX64_13250 [Elusimicrobia bacterium]|nr:hypothetical protein [Elusimicrobiota bacterium]